MVQKMKYSVSVFFPVYNDSKSVPILVRKTIQTLNPLVDDFEIILVNDGSKDNSAEVIEALAKKYKWVRTVHHKKNKGYGGALRSGFAHARKDLVFYTDGDGQYDVTELKQLLPLIEHFDVVNGFKIKRSDKIHRTIFGDLYNYGSRIFFNLKVKDVDCDFRLFKRKIFDEIKLISNTGTICVEMMKKVQNGGYSIGNVPVHHYDREHGTSQFWSIRRIFRSLTAYAKMWIKLMVWRDYG